jgi:hypothetical protein
MIEISPKSLHFIDFAMRDASPHDRAVWAAVDRDTSRELPPPALDAALHALQVFEKKIQARLASSGLDEDETADLSNNLGTVRSIERGLTARRVIAA